MLSTSKLYAVRRASFMPWPVEWPDVSTLRGFYTGKLHRLPLGAGTLYEFAPGDGLPSYYLREHLFTNA